MVSTVHTTAGVVREADAREKRKHSIRGRHVQEIGDAQHHLHRWHRHLIRNILGCLRDSVWQFHGKSRTKDVKPCPAPLIVLHMVGTPATVLPFRRKVGGSRAPLWYRVSIHIDVRGSSYALHRAPRTQEDTNLS